MIIKKTIRYILLSISMFLPQVNFASEDDHDIRLNPVIDGASVASNVSLSNYDFINKDANHIHMNGHSWDELKAKFDEISEGRTVSIVHIGDSHIQAEGNTSRIRKYLQHNYGDAGRGLIIPFRLAGTNQPFDYRITSSVSMKSAKLLKNPWPTTMGFTGISLATPNEPFTLNISNEQVFKQLTIIGRCKINVIAVTSGSESIEYTSKVENGCTLIKLNKELHSVSLKIDAPEANIFGIELRNGKSGVVYSAIGNNGAAFSSYTRIPNFGHSLSTLNPDLVIISLGTNEAFGKITDEAFYKTIKNFVDEVRKNNPGVEILLTTPSECQRSVYTKVRTGRKRRRRTRRVRSYAVNQNVARLASVIRRFGKDNHIPVYDFYEVAGGDGASAKWVNSRLLAGDRIHRTWAGYHLEGDLMHGAFIEALGNPPVEISVDANVKAENISPEDMVNAAFAESSAKHDQLQTSTQVKERPKTKVKKKTKKNSKKKSRKSSKKRRRR